MERLQVERLRAGIDRVSKTVSFFTVTNCVKRALLPTAFALSMI